MFNFIHFVLCYSGIFVLYFENPNELQQNICLNYADLTGIWMNEL